MNELELIVQKIEDKLATLERTRDMLSRELETERAQLRGIETTLNSLRELEAQISPHTTTPKRKK